MTWRALALALVAGLAGCDHEVNPNLVDEALLRPLALPEDQRQMQEYMAQLPQGAYKEYRLDGVGKFYVDDDKDFIKRHVAENKAWEPWLVMAFEMYVKPGTTVIDAGAHIGVHTLSLARLVGPKGRVYAFEPQRKIYRELVFNLRLNGIENVVPLRYALGHTPGVVQMDPATTANEGSTKLGKGGDRVELRPLDSFAFRNVSLLKIDVEEFEDFLLEGAQLTIARNRPVIIIEIMGNHDPFNAPPDIKAKIEGTKSRLKAMGYEVAPIRGVDYLALPR